MQAVVEFLVFASVPVAAACVGGLTNLIGLAIAFFPAKRIQLTRRFAWQGIIPAKADVMVETAFDLITARLDIVDEVLRRLDPQALAQELLPVVEQVLEEVIDDVLAQQRPGTWRALPKQVRAEIIERSKREAAPVISDVVREIKSGIHTVLDIKRLVIEPIERDRRLITKIFVRAGRRELRFLVLAGFALGFLLGCVELGAAALLGTSPWLFVAGGAAVGALTNWLALQLVFFPVEPIRKGRFTWHGLFPRRQAVVAGEIARFAVGEIIDLSRVVHLLFQGEPGKQVAAIIERNVKAAFDDLTFDNRRLVEVALGRRAVERTRGQIASVLAGRAAGFGKQAVPYLKETLALEAVISAKLQSLAPREFVGIIRPVFQGEEYKLVLGGAAAGLVIGALQGIAAALLL